MSNLPSQNGMPSRSHLRFWGAVIGLFFLFLYLIRGILLPFVVGLLAAYFLDPAVRHLRSRGWSRSGAASVITIGFFVVVSVACSLLVPMILQQLAAFVREFPSYWTALEARYGEQFQHFVSTLSPDQVQSLKTAASNMGSSVTDVLGRVVPGMLQSGLAVLNVLSLVFLTPVVVFYLLRDWEVFVRRVDDILPRDHADTIRKQLHAIDLTLSGFIRGQTNVCLLMAAYYGIGLSVVGLKFGLGIGILTGFLLFIPFVGYATSALVCLMIGLFQFGWGSHVMALLAVFGVGVMLESGFITPKLVGSKVGLHPIWIIFGMLAGASLFGFVGVLISLPVTAVIGVLVRFALVKYLASAVYHGE